MGRADTGAAPHLYEGSTGQEAVDRGWSGFRSGKARDGAAQGGFAAQLKDATDADAVRVDLLTAVHRALEPTHAPVWKGQHEIR